MSSSRAEQRAEWELVRVCVSNGADLIRLVEWVEEKIVLGGQLLCRPLRATGLAAVTRKKRK